jgi:hypothetical protein
MKLFSMQQYKCGNGKWAIGIGSLLVERGSVNRSLWRGRGLSRLIRAWWELRMCCGSQIRGPGTCSLSRLRYEGLQGGGVAAATPYRRVADRRYAGCYGKMVFLKTPAELKIVHLDTDKYTFRETFFICPSGRAI